MPAVRETSTSRRMNTYTVCVPQGAESSFLRTMSRNMGWTIKAVPRLRTTVTRPKTKKEDPTLMTKEEFYAMIDEAKEEVRQGKVSPVFHSAADAIAYLESL